MKRMLGIALLLASCGSGEAADVRAAQAAAFSDNRAGQVARVMTRNLYLGADLGAAMRSTSAGAFVVANGAVLRQVTATNFPVRAKGLAAEILAANPDLVGLEEAALWRTGPLNLAVLAGAPKTATTVRFDYLQLLLNELNKDELRYVAAVVQEEFDLEAPADEDGNYVPEKNARLTMRDVILERVDAGIHTWNPQAGHYASLFTPNVAGIPVPVTRGWASVDARVRGSAPFRFAMTHFEAFDPRTDHPSIRARQAGELAALLNASELPVVLVGDLNSDDDTVVADDQQAYRKLLDSGFVERSTANPLSCCVESYDLTTGAVSEFDHQVDHVMTNADATVTLIESTVTGREMVNGFWDSDHAGVFSSLRIR